ncbi:MAG: hypothetical protein RLZZ455_1118 [Candidatus Parcubacteria bacterium]|jgi:GDP-L-fucose synthase
MTSYWKNKKILLTGGSGFFGTHLLQELVQHGVKESDVLIPRSNAIDLRNQKDLKKVVQKIDIVLHLAAKVGGIGFNRDYPAEMFYDNIMMGTQLMHESYLAGVKKFVAIGTICCYPKFTPVPFKEDNLWDGYPEETNAPYGLAKKMLLVQAQAYRQQYGFNAIFLLPVNLYGPGDNFDPSSSHVIPALIKKFVDAKNNKTSVVEVWGSGKATREFLFVKDAARAVRMATESYDKPEPVNIGAGFEISIKDLVEKIRSFVGYKGKVVFDTSKPDGQPRRMLDTSRAQREFGYRSEISFDDGLKEVINWYESVFLRTPQG